MSNGTVYRSILLISCHSTILAIRAAHTAGESVLGVLSIVLNIWLLYLIKYHSKFGSDFYRAMLAIDAALDLTLAVFVLLGQPVSNRSG